MPSDLDTLLDMGFDKERAELAVKKSGGRRLLPPFINVLADPILVQGALQWLEDNQDKPLEEIKAAASDDKEDDEDDDTEAKIAELETGKAKSLVCNECGKRFRSHDLASYHATKTYVNNLLTL